MRKTIPMFILSMALLGGCQSTIPKNALVLSKESLQTKQLQTRRYDTTDETKVLSAVAGVLQDMGFNLNESEAELGVLTASKRRSAVNAGQQALAVVAALFGTNTPTDKEQVMQASVVTYPFGKETAVRVTFQRVVWNTNNEVTTAEALQDPEMYQGFFEKLSKSIFLEAHQI
ncbi:MAG: hypothetical protein JW764_06365 [Chlorobiaceae bacterium]|nr:hypothetical protein [Chlorobiaceae bacterium]